MSNHYVWDAASVELKTKRASVQAGYKNGAKDFEHYVDWMRYNLDWFSKTGGCRISLQCNDGYSGICRYGISYDD